jgi:hypothetical protein
MRTTWLAGIAGAMLLGLGVTGAAWVGPDDWLDSPAQVLNPGGEVAVVTNYGLLSYSLPLRVTASAENGEVFVGIGHAVDVDDYLRDTTAVGIDWFSPGGLTSHRQTSTSASLPATPTAVDFWRAKASGPGSQTVAGSFAGQPVEAVISTGSGEPSPLRVSLGSQLAGAFAASMSLIAIGLALLAFTTWRWWRARRTPKASESTPPEPAPAHPLRALRTTFAVLVSWSVLLVGSGCSAEQLNTGMVPVPPRTELTRDPVDGLDLAALAADYDRRNNAAIAAAAWPRYSAKEWAQADGELLLAADRFGTAWDRVEKNKPEAAPCRTKLGVAYPGVIPHAYPMTVLVSEVMSCGADPDRTPVNLAAFRRDHSYSPWLHVAVVSAGKPRPPAPAQGEPAIEDRRAVEDAAAEVVGAITGEKVGLTMPADLMKWRTKYLKPTSWSTTHWSAWVQPDGIRIGRSDKGVVALASILITDINTAKPGQWTGWKHPWDRIYHQLGSYRQTVSHYGLMVSLEVIEGKASVLGWYSPDYLD